MDFLSGLVESFSGVVNNIYGAPSEPEVPELVPSDRSNRPVSESTFRSISQETNSNRRPRPTESQDHRVHQPRHTARLNRRYSPVCRRPLVYSASAPTDNDLVVVERENDFRNDSISTFDTRHPNRRYIRKRSGVDPGPEEDNARYIPSVPVTAQGPSDPVETDRPRRPANPIHRVRNPSVSPTRRNGTKIRTGHIAPFENWIDDEAAFNMGFGKKHLPIGYVYHKGEPTAYKSIPKFPPTRSEVAKRLAEERANNEKIEKEKAEMKAKREQEEREKKESFERRRVVEPPGLKPGMPGYYKQVLNEYVIGYKMDYPERKVVNCSGMFFDVTHLVTPPATEDATALTTDNDNTTPPTVENTTTPVADNTTVPAVDNTTPPTVGHTSAPVADNVPASATTAYAERTPFWSWSARNIISSIADLTAPVIGDSQMSMYINDAPAAGAAAASVRAVPTAPTSRFTTEEYISTPINTTAVDPAPASDAAPVTSREPTPVPAGEATPEAPVPASSKVATEVSTDAPAIVTAADAAPVKSTKLIDFDGTKKKEEEDMIQGQYGEYIDEEEDHPLSRLCHLPKDRAFVERPRLPMKKNPNYQKVVDKSCANYLALVARREKAMEDARIRHLAAKEKALARARDIESDHPDDIEPANEVSALNSLMITRELLREAEAKISEMAEREKEREEKEKTVEVVRLNIEDSDSDPDEESPRKRAKFTFSDPILTPTFEQATTVWVPEDTVMPDVAKPVASIDIFKQAATQWKCDVCLVMNATDRTHCIACETARSTDVSNVAKPVARGSSAAPIDIFKQASTQWKCDVCLVMNATDRACCIACETARTTAVSNVAKPIAPTAPVDIFKQAATQWKCDVCLVMNATDRTSCIACETVRATAASNVAKPVAPTAPVDIFKQGSTQWKCDVCLIMNAMDRTRCIACETAKVVPPTATSASKEATKTAAKLSPVPVSAGWGTLFDTSKGQWECDDCLVNNAKEATCCIACQKVRKVPTVEPEIEIASAPIPPVTSGWGNIFKQDEGKWECQGCLISNAKEATKCVACEKVRETTPTTSDAKNKMPEAGPITGWGNTFKQPEGQWSCDSCLLSNSKEATQCISCQKERSLPTEPDVPVPKSKLSTAAIPLAVNGWGDIFKDTKGQWTCDSCLVRNAHDAVSCSVCTTTRP